MISHNLETVQDRT